MKVPKMKKSKKQIKRESEHLESSGAEATQHLAAANRALLESEKRMKVFAWELNEAVEEERSRIAREIHDEFGQGLSGLKMALSSLKTYAEIPPWIEAAIDRMLDEVDQNIYLLRKIANELRPVILDKLGLFAALEWLVKEFENKTGVITNSYIDIHQPAIHKTQEIHLFRICQEALTNITKHAKATRVTIRVENKGNLMHIEIADNGEGIKPDDWNHPLSMGLLNMQERAKAIGAKISIKSLPYTGTVIALTIPVNKNKINPTRPPDR
jgi:signal transduction histidine kinase